MLSRKQKRVWRYVEEGSVLKLKSYLRRHRDLDVNFSHGRRERSPLHLACCLGEDAALRLLLRHGADVLQKNRKGDTVLHVAVNKALKNNNTGEGDSVKMLWLTYISYIYNCICLPLYLVLIGHIAYLYYVLLTYIYYFLLLDVTKFICYIY